MLNGEQNISQRGYFGYEKRPPCLCGTFVSPKRAKNFGRTRENRGGQRQEENMTGWQGHTHHQISGAC